MRWDGAFDGQVAIVAACAAGIGRAAALRLAEGGARLGLLDRDEAGLGTLVSELEARGAEVLAVRCDATRSSEIDAAVAQVVGRFGGLDALVNAVGGWVGQPSPLVQETTEQAWNDGLALNLTSGFLLAKAVIPHLIARGGGRIVNVGSLTARAQLHLTAPFYASSKAALHMLSRYLAKELGPHKITVNVVAPGPIWTPRTTPFFSGALEQKMVAETPLGRIGESDDVAEVIAFLCSDAARHITGATLDINGGYLIV